jgi:hypothetical protein
MLLSKNMLALTKKEVELKHLEMARAASSIIPPGEVQWGENPDLRIQTPSGVLGVEVTKLFQAALPGEARTPMHERGLRHDVIAEAKLRYEKKGGPPVTVEVFFSVFNLPRQWTQASEVLAQLVFEVTDIPANGRALKFGVYSRSGYQQINIRPPLCGRAEWIEASESDRPQELQYQDVKNIVDAKTLRLAKYQSMALGTWLLMVVDPFPRAAYVCVPKAADSWMFRSSFERLLLFSREDNRVFEFGKS